MGSRPWMLRANCRAALAINNTTVVNSQAAQLAVVAQVGDVVIRTDTTTSYIQNGGATGTMSDWTQILSPMGVTTG
jgi:hypothetical protein